MLKNLTVKNFVLVEALDIGFGEGLTVVTGESGAGKSILLDALGLVLGERAAQSYIRPDTESCEVTAEFDLSGRTAALALLDAQALSDADDPERCLVRRVASREGRSRTFINGSPVNLSVLQQLTEPLVDVHGQHAHYSLLERPTQLALLDDYAGNADLAATVRARFAAWQAVERERDTLAAAIEAERERAALLRYQAEELDALGLEAGEVPRLESEVRRLSQAREIQRSVGAGLETLDDDVRAPIAQIASALRQIDDDHPQLAAGRELLDAALTHVDEANAELRHYLDAVPVDDARLRNLEERLDAIHDVARKHRVSPDALIEHQMRISDSLGGHEHDTSRLETLAAACREAEASFRADAARLSKSRQRAGKAFAKDVCAALEELGLARAKLEVEFEPAEGPQGLETVELRVATNPKYPGGSLKQIASGGELARISLAIQVVAAARSALPCLVLDEADVGVSGTTADVLGRMLRRLAEHTQVICVTHAPQVAALGSLHLRVEKTTEQDTVITPLDRRGRIEELARMLGGQRVTGKTRDYAETLLAEGALA